ncbi:DUF4912 domain-containing protein [Candidatus Methylacidiphilum fumarolicum]|uniref:DUF4912 domain-containing protein n=2 Tax=Candidatus Methylacidiphilum fumarolicum TaxID=591154 RepID=I0JXH2_METFB|nr:DUF4912 domain-containing protein [Candidatus Methylacidiphilum fumarolicum]MBW6415283.1 DUF4912 domain-containing protein [Candidatus Methylacidiphilum fumarolicum]TFE69262.1 hypothetical protein A7K73_06280 [Candidatus Methylacidiphilum fumarolicum]TFE72213.1 DUF4912 domain-containing protein [Candidatus Methylacidiphilum fumarolicum]TFE72354.1 DUF4912 domain-containing protein [Candidatus Methylacidiphilum fumarolicum]TFE76988.1 hypothetical protein A7D33_07195 [Candidatus Methylacidiphi
MSKKTGKKLNNFTLSHPPLPQGAKKSFLLKTKAVFSSKGQGKTQSEIQLSAAAQPSSSPPIPPSLPKTGRKQLFFYLFAVDPHALHAYWIMDQKAFRAFEKSRWVFRLVSNGSQLEAELPLEKSTHRIYYTKAKPNTRYHAEIGFYISSSNHFILIAKSPEAHTPPLSFSAKNEIRLATLPPQLSFQELIQKATKKGIKKETVAEAFELPPQKIQQLLTEKESVIQSSEQTPNLFSFPDSIQNFLFPQDPSLSSSYSSPIPPYTPLKEFSSFEFFPWFQPEDFPLQFLWPASFGFEPKEGSFPQNEPPESRHFPLELEVELVIRGKTSPNALLKVSNKKMQVAEDGSFTFRFDFVDGIYEVPIEAFDQENLQAEKLVLFFSRFSRPLLEVQSFFPSP